jgi:dihydrofolate reductase
MGTLRVHNVSMSVDGYAAGPDQSLEAPLGVGGEALHEWALATATMRRVFGLDAGAEGVDDDYIRRGEQGIGATIMGRNMFGPVRGPWPQGDEELADWRGWWGEEPPYHHPVFVLTHHAREPLEMIDTTFHFVTGGIEEAHTRALEAADGADVRIGGGASTIQAYLRAGLVDELHVAIVPRLLGGGERLFDNLAGGPEGLVCTEFVATPGAAHAVFTRV